MKICSICEESKNDSEFNKDSSCKDNLRYQCKYCQSLYNKEYRKTKGGKEVHRKGSIKYQQKLRQTEEGKEAHRQDTCRQRMKFPDRIKAYCELHMSIITGIMRRSVFCESCGLPAKTEGHHEDYDKPREVIWLCKRCHVNIPKVGGVLLSG
ncbi:hypothetical protein LCGC14_2434910 [marine sediment metagenome]|uniref:Uncharacterized protein n=1 Tax=marine sediment metagenome TaxID=412755 RepID=A0A0F9C860_9ZZZZ